MTTLHRDADGTLPAFAWPGGYQMVYITRDGMTIRPECANRETDDSQAPIAGDVYWEGRALDCDDCGAAVPSAYGDPDADDPPLPMVDHLGHPTTEPTTVDGAESRYCATCDQTIIATR